MWRRSMVFFAIALAASLASAAEPDVQALIAELKGEARVAKRSPHELQAIHLKVLDALLPKLADKDPYVRQEAERTYRRICWRASRPGAEIERAAAAKAIVARLRPDLPEPALLCLLEQLEHIGRDEAVEAVAKLLDARDPKPPFIRERARRALLANPSPKAIEALRRALAKAKEPAWRVALINALGARRDKASVGTLIELARSREPAVRDAAIEALARIGDEAAAAVIAQASQDAGPREWRTAIVAYLLLADNLLAAGDKATALEMYKSLLEAEGHIRCAALIGTGKAGGPAELKVLMAALNDPEPEIRGAATSALNLLPIETLRQATAQAAKTGSPETKVLLLGLLASRADAASLPTMTALASDPDERVRVAAYRAMAATGSAEAVRTLVGALARAKGKELKALADTLERMPGQATTDALVASLKKGSAAVKTQVIRVLASRKDPAAVAPLLVAAKDPDRTVRLEALKAIGSYAGAEALKPLVGILLAAADQADIAACEKALASVASRVERGAASKAIVPALAGAAVPARCALIRVLAKVGGDEALKAVRAALESGTPQVAEAAIRSLGSWPDPSPAQDLLRLAKTAANLQHHVLALRGLLNLLSLEDGLPAEKKLDLYSAAMAAARRLEEKKAILGALAAVVHPRALHLAEAHLNDPQLRAEAGLATAAIASSLIGSHREQARAALEKLLENPPNDMVKKKAQQALDQLAEFEDYITAWQVAGPYSAKGKSGPALHDVAFPPEEPNAKGVEWKVMPPGGGEKRFYPFVMDLYRRFKRENSVAYLRTWVWSPAEQKARLEFGSDDGAKVWLNGQLVVNAPKPRSFQPAEDKVIVTLKQGWNPLLVKVWNGGLYWGAALRLRAPDGARLKGLKASIEPK